MQAHILGFPSIGKHRELKYALESFWQNKLSADSLAEISTELKNAIGRFSRTLVLTM